jgi:hypothetical protein
MLLQLLLLTVCSCLSVEAATIARSCSGSACLEYTQRFTTVFSSYNLPSVSESIELYYFCTASAPSQKVQAQP